MSFDVKIIADSVGPRGNRITTMQLCYPRFIHAEFMTHRVFSRNASSSRAIPVAKLIEQVRNNPVMPVHWGKNQPGMQADEELSPENIGAVRGIWRDAAYRAANYAETMARFGAHKQIVNRILEPWQWMHTIVTATEWDNFFALRCHKDAQPEIRRLAEFMRETQHRSVPKKLDYGQWHLPYVNTEIEDDGEQSYRHKMFFDPPIEGHPGACGVQFLNLEQALKASVARCARVSYLTHDG
jgi:thymidylate synthase ThyX